MRELHKKSEAGLVTVLIIVIGLFFFGWLINVSQRECKTNRDCGSEAYCGSDFSCHQFPIIQKTVVQYNLLGSSIIIGLAIVIAAVIFRWDKIIGRKESQKNTAEPIKQKISQEVEDISEPYYKSDSNIKTP